VGGYRVLERPVPCWGDPDRTSNSCLTEARVVFVQLRPDQSGRPVTFIAAGCLAHQRGIRLWLGSSWPFDEVDSFGVEQADDYLAALLGSLTADGAHVLDVSGVG